MLRIGIDFDNTIACYDQSFPVVAKLLGLLNSTGVDSKNEVKKNLLSRENGDIEWQRLQGQVYGQHMLQAVIFPGFLEFLCLSKLRGHQLFIVSHKSEFGHFDEELIPLRGQALKWLEINGLMNQEMFLFQLQNLVASIERLYKCCTNVYLGHSRG